MESSGLESHTVTHPTELLITCTNVDTQAEETELEDRAHQQISALAEQYHLVDQNGHAIHYEIQALPGTSPQMMILASESENGQVFHVIPSSQPGTAQLIIPQDNESAEHDQISDNLQNVQTVTANAVPEASSFIIHSNTSLAVCNKSPTRWTVESFQKPIQPLPLNFPVWARRLRSCEKIGDSYRGYCLSEAELMNILGLHKQQTMSVWGTRQSPSPAKPATRLMWKSQYVPYDGIPFVNAGSRAIVMECQYGPRRKGAQPKRSVEGDNASGQSYKATCPARIYIKKVKKFPKYRVPTDPKIDKKMIKMEQEKAFNFLKKDLDSTEGILRWYVQLPDQEAHQYHSLDASCFSPSPTSFQPPNEEEEEVVCDENNSQPSRLHPCVAEKIRDLVSKGIDEVYSVRKQLRKFVERELFKPEEVPERHNLSCFPTVNDLKNHIHEAQKSLGNGDLIYDQETVPGSVRELQWTSDNGSILNEMVTVTFEATSQEEQVENSPSEDMCPDTAQLISSLTSLQPKIFAQLQGLQLQPSFTSSDGTTALIAVNQSSSTFTSPDETTAVITVNPQTSSLTSSDAATALITVNHSAPSFTSSDGTTALITLNHQPQSFTSADGTTSLITVSQPGLLNAGSNSQPLVLSHLHSQPCASSVTTLPGSGHNIVSMGQLVTVEDASGISGEVHQILLGGLHPIPFRILENQPTIVEVSPLDAFCTEQIETKKQSSEAQSHENEAGTTDCQDHA
ncbi:PREDICTED: calcium-responsive transcription factor [Nanorana parkeri]|uniref:calcium-responsive transcription factor n=1 Tax=Nanorana parkeri TaxID=125878 RepID=UPI000854762F|nr:PREDICTED: calcium-responsive transcription factor [Nanorana parkeri]